MVKVTQVTSRLLSCKVTSRSNENALKVYFKPFPLFFVKVTSLMPRHTTIKIKVSEVCK